MRLIWFARMLCVTLSSVAAAVIVAWRATRNRSARCVAPWPTRTRRSSGESPARGSTRGFLVVHFEPLPMTRSDGGEWPCQPKTMAAVWVMRSATSDPRQMQKLMSAILK